MKVLSASGLMASNYERVREALDLLRSELRLYVEQELRAAYGESWLAQAASTFPSGRLPHATKGAANWDNYALLSVMVSSWYNVFGKKLGRAERSLVEEVRNIRNDRAHEKPLSIEDTYRALDTIERLLRAIGADDSADAVKSLRLQALDDLKPEANRLGAAQTIAHDSTPLQTHKIAKATPLTGAVKGKYRSLYAYLTRVKDDETTMTFDEIEHVLGGSLPPSARQYPAWWANEDPQKTLMVQKRAWLLAGFKAYPDFATGQVRFKR